MNVGTWLEPRPYFVCFYRLAARNYFKNYLENFAPYGRKLIIRFLAGGLIIVIIIFSNFLPAGQSNTPPPLRGTPSNLEGELPGRVPTLFAELT